VTADDVVFTVNLIRNPEIDCRGLASYFDDCEKVEKIDDHTVRYLWKKPYFKSLEVSGLTPVMPRSVYEKVADPKLFNEIVKSPIVGPGPYVLERWDTGQELILARRPGYWKKPPAIERISYKFILEEQAQMQAFLSGDLDYIDEEAMTPEMYLKLKANPENDVAYRLYKFSRPDRGYAYIGWNNEHLLFADKRVRQALTLLINRQQIVDKLLNGLATVISGPFWPESLQCDQSVKPWPYDPDAALKLLKEAGWWDRKGDGVLRNEKGEPFIFELSVPAGQQVVRDQVGVIQDGFHKAGIEMNAKFYEWSVFVSKLNNRDFDAVRLGWGGMVEDDPYQIWHSSSIANRGSNHVGFKNAEADRLIVEARSTLDEAKRNEIYHKLHRLLHEEQPYTFLWTNDCLAAFAARVHGVKVHKLGLDDREWYLGKPVLDPKESAAP
jgi:peptide/nickel transport system substrate-binding protein